MNRKPDYSVAALNKATDAKGQIGAAWKNDDNTISVILNDFVVVKQEGDLLITLFPKSGSVKPKKKKKEIVYGVGDGPGDGPPF